MRTCVEVTSGIQIIADWNGEEGECLARKSILSFASRKHLCIHNNHYCPYSDHPLSQGLMSFPHLTIVISSSIYTHALMTSSSEHVLPNFTSRKHFGKKIIKRNGAAKNNETSLECSW